MAKHSDKTMNGFLRKKSTSGMGSDNSIKSTKRTTGQKLKKQMPKPQKSTNLPYPSY